MAHFAQLDENNVVTQVIVVGNEQLKATVTTEVDGFLVSQTVESEAKGVEFCKTLYGADTTWKQTSYNASFRGAYAGIGYTFEGGVFVAPVAPVVEEVAVETPVESLTTDPIVGLTTDSISAISESGTASISMASASNADSITIETSNTGV